MIQLIGVLSEGGVPVHVKSAVDSDGEMILGPLIEASKSLSALMGSGEVRKLAFQDNTMIVTESRKGYTIVALVSRAEDYMDTLLRVIADAIDHSEIPKADGAVTPSHKTVVEEVVNTFIRDRIDTSFVEAVSSLWNPILSLIQSDGRFKNIKERTEDLLQKPPDYEAWMQFKESVDASISDGLAFAMRGEFDRACAATIDLEDTTAKIFAIKMGILTHSITNAKAPPLIELQKIADTLRDSHPLAGLAITLVGLASGDVIPADYSRAFRDATAHFDFVDGQENQMLGFLFLDTRVPDFPEFSKKIRLFYEGKSRIVCAYIEALDERTRIFDKLYSITSYDAFRDELGVYKSTLSGVLQDIDMIFEPDLLKRLKREGRSHEVSITASFKLQNYIALMTALAESPVLTIGERREVLEEVIGLYRSYFRNLMETEIPLFAFTVDSVFQSLAVAYSEYYAVATGDTRKEALKDTAEFLADVVGTIEREWPKARVRFSLFVVANAIFPVMTKARILIDEQIQLIYIAMQLLDYDTIDAMQITRTDYYATSLGNTVTSLTALASTLLHAEKRAKALELGVNIAMEVQEWFISNGIVCRDDIVSATYHATLAADVIDNESLERIVDQVTALNTVAIQDPARYDYEVAMMASPLLELLIKAWNRLGHKRYLELAKTLYDSAAAAWKKYGLEEKARNFDAKFGGIMG
ncbi:MAG: hypothetical protein EAX95_10175 [Candidatus Thorarchaeota archaeon]|nr:hypothetical protein [Candidatus Thorarchaeota archaeon]